MPRLDEFKKEKPAQKIYENSELRQMLSDWDYKRYEKSALQLMDNFGIDKMLMDPEQYNRVLDLVMKLQVSRGRIFHATDAGNPN